MIMNKIRKDKIELEIFSDKDIPSLNKILAKESTVRFLPIESHKSLEDTKCFYNRLKEDSNNCIWKINYIGDDYSKMIGLIDLTNIRDKSANIAYIINPEYAGSGVATSVINTVIHKAFDDMGLNKITAPVVSRNIGSWKVLEKNGFFKTGNGKDKVFFDKSEDEVLLYSLFNISKRQATSEDIDFVFDTKKEALYQYIKKIWGWDEEVQYKWLTLTYLPENISILTHGEKDIGLLEICRNENHIDLVNIEIIKEYRCLGIGTNIIKNIINNITPAHRVSLRVFRNNFKAINLYKRLGFVKFGSTEYHDLYEYTLLIKSDKN